MTDKLNLDNFKDRYKNMTDGETALTESLLMLIEQLNVIARKL